MKAEFEIPGRLVRFKVSDGLMLNGFLHSSGKKVIVHVHGMTANFYDDLNVQDLVRAAEKSGHSFFSINTRGHDIVSDTPRVSGEWKRGGTALERFEDCLKDIRGALDFVSRRGYSHIVLSGHSTGCQKIAYYQAKARDRRVKGLVLLAPADDLNSDIKIFGKKKFEKMKSLAKKSRKDSILPKELAEDVMISAGRFLSYAEEKNEESRLFNYKSDMSTFSKITCPILAVFGDRDKFLTMSAEKTLKILGSKSGSERFSHKIIYGANHCFAGKGKQLSETIWRWAAKL